MVDSSLAADPPIIQVTSHNMQEEKMVDATRLNGRVALVTGGASGQGAAHTKRLATEGAIVHFADIAVEAGKEYEAKLRADGLDVTFHELDVRSAASWQKVYEAIEDRHAQLDILANNAGIVDLLGAEQATEETWQRTIDVNQKGVFLGIKYALPLLRKSPHASIINTASINGLIGTADYFAYTASKGAVAAMTKSAAITYGPEGIRVNSIHPGFVETPMLEQEWELLDDGAQSESISLIPLRRFCSADEIASVVAFLASDDASYIHGAEIVIDGGLIAGR
jgi:cyclopentanol dehydrogenase